ncbi:MAG TPA: hypothetical protein VFO16_18195 [Pseudonocardiaceae bacterium]|nr:hypothetical protein [Pseudonocardiaceae bacterium]
MGFSVAGRMTGFLIAAVVGGRPGWRRAVRSHFRETSRRCQARSVAGVTGEDPGPAMTGHKPGQGSQPHPADGPVAHPGDLRARHDILVP